MISRSNKDDHAEISRRLQDTAGIERALARAGRQVLREAALMGEKIPFWRDGQVVWEVPELPEPEQPEVAE